MSTEVVIAVLSLLGTCLGTGGGIIASAKLTNYRIAQLEKKVDKHNNFAERMPVLEEKMDDFKRRLEVLEKNTVK